MNESRIAATDRLRREGRWEAASQFRDAKRREFKEAGKNRTEANEMSWEAMLAEFPPLPIREFVDADAAVRPTDVEIIAAILARKDGEKCDALREVTWVYNHVGDDDLLPEEFPSLGAWSMWNWARANRARFYERLWPKAEAARGECFEQSYDTETEEDRRFWREQMAEDLPTAMHHLAANALRWDVRPRFDAPAPPIWKIRVLRRLMYQLSLRYVAKSFGD